jgi:hypothetical protein
MTLWSFLGVSKKQKEECKRMLCATPAGQFLNSMSMPLTAFSGGIIPPCCPLTPSAAELADQGAVGAAAAIKAEEAQAKARRAAMRYLGTVDCGRFPAAGKALYAGLRADTNECVRYEAALALGNGCCCTKEIMEGLAVSAACSDRDGFPRETSDRVRAAAVVALQNCLACFVDPNPPAAKEKTVEGAPVEGAPTTPPPPPPAGAEQPTADKKDAAKTESKPKHERPVGMAYYDKIKDVPRHLIIEEARRVVEKYSQTASAEAVLGRGNSLVNVVNRALGEPASGPVFVMENGLPVARAEIVSGRPQNLWDMLTRASVPTAPVVGPAGGEVIVQNTSEPPAVVRIDPVPLPVKSEPLPVLTKPETVTKSAPALPRWSEIQPAPRPATTAQPVSGVPTGPYGERMILRPKTPAELAGRPKAVEAPAPAPTPLPSTLTQNVAKPAERQSLKPVEPKFEPVVVPPAPAFRSVPTPLAQRALTVFRDPHPAPVREHIAGSLGPADLKSCPDLAPALLGVAKGTEADSTRKAAIKALVKCQAGTPDVISALEKLTDDPSPAVRVEAAIGMAHLKVGSPMP